ncbi:hypothetical protein LB465_17805 [Salegentibacter sp. LM13S]|uniref:hypothetical protein n=1 Tax=Salegentibacter lacus TaxID=2873599 RepID=UPI001CCB2A18|nr:hypothetical protein [Salegentibacter lacus]MBZ9632637.1 hypothetical protein [Salegentibacter lacus]
MKITFDIKYFLILTHAFIVFTAIGTVSHEYGHILVAKYLGYETTLHYGSMNYNSDLNEELVEIYIQNETAIENDGYFDKKNEYENGIKKLQSNGLWITIGGPLQTILTGLIGLTILLIRKSQIRAFGLKIIDWLAIFLSLFWLREVFNLVTSVGSEITSPVGSYFGGDEKFISFGLNLWEGTIPIILGFFGLLISLFVIFKIIPNRLRLTFILSGLIGGIIGFILWMDIIGPKILP